MKNGSDAPAIGVYPTVSRCKSFCAACARTLRNVVVIKKIASQQRVFFTFMVFLLSDEDLTKRPCLLVSLPIENLWCAASNHRQSKIENHLITLSARYKTDCGIVRPICLAVLRFITNSNFVGCSTGRSAGFVPFKILSTKYAARWPTSPKLAPYDMRPPAST